MSEKIKKFKIPIYGGQLWVCVTNSFLRSIESIENSLDVVLDDRKEDLRSTGAITYMFITHDGVFVTLVMIKPSTSFGVIAHEALHVVNWIFIHCGIQYSIKNDEPQCYLLGWAVDRIMESKNSKR
jgi:hypothetical protein